MAYSTFCQLTWHVFNDMTVQQCYNRQIRVCEWSRARFPGVGKGFLPEFLGVMLSTFYLKDLLWMVLWAWAGPTNGRSVGGVLWRWTRTYQMQLEPSQNEQGVRPSKRTSLLKSTEKHCSLARREKIYILLNLIILIIWSLCSSLEIDK